VVLVVVTPPIGSVLVGAVVEVAVVPVVPDVFEVVPVAPEVLDVVLVDFVDFLAFVADGVVVVVVPVPEAGPSTPWANVSCCAIASISLWYPARLPALRAVRAFW